MYRISDHKKTSEYKEAFFNSIKGKSE